MICGTASFGRAGYPMPPFPEHLPPLAATVVSVAVRRSNVLMFAAGFLFDFLTMHTQLGTLKHLLNAD